MHEKSSIYNYAFPITRPYKSDSRSTWGRPYGSQPGSDHQAVGNGGRSEPHRPAVPDTADRTQKKKKKKKKDNKVY